MASLDNPDASDINVSRPKIRIWDVASQQEVSPAIEESFAINERLRVRLREDDRVAFGFPNRKTLDLTFDPRPVSDLVKLAQLYSGRRLDTQCGFVPLRREEMEALWRELRAKYPEEFAVSPEAAVDWRIGQLQATTNNQRTACALHRRWLAAELAEAGWQPGERGNEKMKLDIHLIRLLALAQYGRHADAVSAAEALANRWLKDGDTLFQCACVHAVAAGAVQGDAALTNRYAGRAVALLRQAVGAGFKDTDQILKNPDLDAIRRREEFAQLLWDLAEAP